VGAFVNEADAQRDKALNGAAYAVLFFNARYLIERLGP